MTESMNSGAPRCLSQRPPRIKAQPHCTGREYLQKRSCTATISRRNQYHPDMPYKEYIDRMPYRA